MITTKICCRTAIVLLNWNGWRDTIACADSLLKMTCQDFVLVICDNDSKDGSFAEITAWAGSCLPRETCVWSPVLPLRANAKIILIQTGSNLGFAGGCNVGIRFALKHTSAEFIWLLNNDTIVDPGSLAAQLSTLASDSSIGILGSTIASFDDPSVVQCFGGSGFNYWNGRVRSLPFTSTRHDIPPSAAVQPHLRYVSGASMLVTRQFLEAVGLMNEQYFLYFEEIDWAVRGKAFRLGFCPDSVIYHKEGRSIGSNRDVAARSARSERWLARNRVLFTRTYFPFRVPLVLTWMFMAALIRLMFGPRRQAIAMLSGARDGILAGKKTLPQIGRWPETMPQPRQTIC